jgi:hypothetical protein
MYTLLWLSFILTWQIFLTLTAVFPCCFLSCKANAWVKLAKTGHGPHSSTLVVICVVLLYCLCVNVYCHRVTTQLQLINISHILVRKHSLNMTTWRSKQLISGQPTIYRSKSTDGLDGHSVDWFPLHTFPNVLLCEERNLVYRFYCKWCLFTTLKYSLRWRAGTFALDWSISWHWPPAQAAIRQTDRHTVQSALQHATSSSRKDTVSLLLDVCPYPTLTEDTSKKTQRCTDLSGVSKSSTCEVKLNSAF